jgi:probable rRNA maturation factor
MSVNVYTEGNITIPYKSVPLKFFKITTQKVLDLLQKSQDSISIILCSNEQIKNINREYRNKNYPTDIITFAYDEQPFPGETDHGTESADIFISLEKAEDQALQYGCTLVEELKRLIVHGVLHTYGFDHEMGEEQANEMFSKEDELLSKLK